MSNAPSFIVFLSFSFLSKATGRNQKCKTYSRKHAVHDLELLAMKEFITRFPMFLFGQKFHAVIDHRSLEYLLSQPHLTDRQIRTIEKFARYDFTVEYQDP